MRKRSLTFVVSLVVLLLSVILPASAQVSVLTQHADNARDGVYSNETQLTPTSTIHKLFTMTLDDPVRGQALILGGLNVSGQPTNVLLVATSPNESGGSTSAYGFNADTGAQLWHVSLGTSAAFSTSTPVVDPNFGSHGALFLVIKDSGGTNTLHALDALTGAELPGSPLTISASMGGDTFNSGQENDRTALLDLSGTIYTSFCHMTDSGTYHGWIIGYKYTGSGFTQNGVWCDTCAGGNAGGIWQGGDGLIYDGTDIITDTGNGSMGGGNFGMSVVKLSPSNLGAVVGSTFVPANAASHSANDQDLNGGGMVLMPGTGGKIFIGPTKYGSMYLVDSTNLGGGAIDTYGSSSTVGHSPVAWNSGTAQYAYIWPSGDALQQYCYSGGSTGGSACHTSSFTNGGTLALSTDPSGGNAILWAFGGSELHAMNPTNVSAADYWNSNMSAGDSTGGGPGGFQYVAVANGKVYAPTGNTLIAYGTTGGGGGCTTAPSAPTGLGATAVSSSQINLSWTASTAGTGCSITYNVYSSTTSGFTPSSGNQIASGVSGTSFSNTGLLASTTYFYLVEAVDSSGSSGPSNQASATTQTGSSGGTCTVLCINGGGPAVSPFVADEDFTGGGTIDHANTINTSNVTNPAPAAVYQSARVTATAGAGTTFSYTIGGLTAGTSYLVRLHFAETFHTTAGSRVFNVSINGTQVLTNFDIFATAGGENIANVQQFTEAANSSGQFVILFTTDVDKALVSGIEIDSTASCGAAPSAPSGLGATATSSSQINLSWTGSTAGSGCSITYTVFRSTTNGFTPSSSNQIASGVTATTFSDTGLAASTTYYYLVEAVDSAGSSAASNQASATTSAASGPCLTLCIDSGATTGTGSWVADEDFSGGNTLDHANTINTSKVTNPAPAVVYQSARDAAAGGTGAPGPTFSYTIGGLTANASYTVRLHFCETFFTAAGSRVFNVTINGTQVLTNFDIVAAAGGENIANIQQFSETANSSGQLVITFVSDTNNALISGIEID